MIYLCCQSNGEIRTSLTYCRHSRCSNRTPLDPDSISASVHHSRFGGEMPFSKFCVINLPKCFVKRLVNLSHSPTHFTICRDSSNQQDKLLIELNTQRVGLVSCSECVTINEMSAAQQGCQSFLFATLAFAHLYAK